MNDTDRLTHQMLVRSRETFAQSVGDFSATGAAHQLFVDLQATINEVEQKSAAYGSGRSDAKYGTQTISATREALLGDLVAIREASKVMNFEDKFPYPPRENDGQLLQLADVYATNSTPLKTQLIAHELPEDFLEDLTEAKENFQAAIASRLNAVGDHIAAREELDDALTRGVEIVRKLTSLIKVRYASNPGKLAEWIAASHIQRPPRRSKPTEPPAPSPPPTP
jgi:hypothetical protein